MRVEIFDHMEECTEPQVQAMLPLVSAQRREQALRYKHTLGQFCCLKSWCMVAHLMAQEGVQMTDFRYNAHGKPFMEQAPYMSISHCAAGIIVAIDEAPIGVDIESIRTANEDLIVRTMNAEEQRQIYAADDTNRAFIRLWTQKEAVVKAQGVGIASFEQLQHLLPDNEWQVRSEEKENYIYSIAYGKLHCFSAKVQTSDL